MWRHTVACPDRYCDKTSTFLDEFHTKGKLSRAGTFTLPDTVGCIVPYELLPIRIKRFVNMMPLDRTKFVSILAYKAAILKLYVYGYLPDTEKAINVRTAHWQEFRKKWHIDAKVDTTPRADKIDIWSKTLEDVNVYMEGAVQVAPDQTSPVLTNSSVKTPEVKDEAPARPDEPVQCTLAVEVPISSAVSSELIESFSIPVVVAESCPPM